MSRSRHRNDSKVCRTVAALFPIPTLNFGTRPRPQLPGRIELPPRDWLIRYLHLGSDTPAKVALEHILIAVFLVVEPSVSNQEVLKNELVFGSECSATIRLLV